MKHWMTRTLAVASLSASAFVLVGCETLEGGITNQAIRQIEKKVTPQVLKVDDVEMGCASTVSLTPLIYGLRGFYGDPSLVESVMLTSAAVCSEADAAQEELRYLRAQRDKRPDEALDARIMQKRLLERTTRRQYASFERMRVTLEKKYFFTYGKDCPTFKRDFDELVYMMGTLGGLQAMQNDMASQQAVGVPTDIAPKADFAMKCLSNAKWWGIPLATRAVVWSLVPGGSEGKDVKGAFDLSMGLGERSGVRVPHAMAAVAAVSADDRARAKEVIRRFANVKNFKQNTDYRFVDEISISLVQIISDRYWTEATGTRTPIGGLGKFWDDPKAAPAGNAEQFLN